MNATDARSLLDQENILRAVCKVWVANELSAVERKGFKYHAITIHNVNDRVLDEATDVFKNYLKCVIQLEESIHLN